MQYDFAVIGGGIVGLATSMALLERFHDSRLIVLEKENVWAGHQSGRNSGVLHSGVYYKPGSEKARLSLEGNRSMADFCRKHGIAFELCGKIIVATRPEELPLLEVLYSRGLANGVPVSELSQGEVRAFEPSVHCLRGIRCDSTGIVDFRQVCRKFVELLEGRGAKLFLNNGVERIHKTRKGYVLETNRDSFDVRFLINCGGLHSDRIARRADAAVPARIVPFRGEYYELRPDRRHLVKNLVYPVPDPKFPFLGVHFTRTIDGRVLVGPSAVLSAKREGYEKGAFSVRDVVDTLGYPGFWRMALRHAGNGARELLRSSSKTAFVKNVQRLIPEIQGDDLVPAPPGVRAQALSRDGRFVEDFLIVRDENAIHVCNAPSPAATSSIEIGRSIVHLIQGSL